jgi:hypothetical protein
MSEIYFIQAGGPRGPIKIGVASYAISRLTQLQAGSPKKLELLATFPGDRATETAIHKQLKRHRVRREWFKPVPEVIEMINAARGGEQVIEVPDQTRPWLPEGITKAQLAKEIGVSPQRVQYWFNKNRIPAEYVLAVEAATGVSRYELRPDIYPQEA